VKDITIFGAGCLDGEIVCLLNIINKQDAQWNIVVFFDDGKRIGNVNKYGTILGGINE